MRTLLVFVIFVLASDTTLAAGSDYADGLAGGPDYWAVANVPADDTLNVREGPGTGKDVIGALANGDVVRNLGCRKVGASRWCRIKALQEQRFSGWVNGRFLIEAAAPTDGPQPCSKQWQLAVDKKLQTGDGDGHGPDIGSMEWRSVVEFKLGVRGDPAVPSRATVKWCRYIDALMR